MQGTISDIMVEKITQVGVDDSVEEVESILGVHHYSCVPVVDPDNNCFGIITSNDITSFHTQGQNPKTVLAWEICSHELIEVPPSLPIREAAQLMINNNIHHLVVSEDQCVKGIISSIDLLAACIANTSP